MAFLVLVMVIVLKILGLDIFVEIFCRMTKTYKLHVPTHEFVLQTLECALKFSVFDFNKFTIILCFPYLFRIGCYAYL